MDVEYLDMTTGQVCQGELRDYSRAALARLDRAYGYSSFRPGQLEAVNAILNRRDLIAVMPTGSGKSVCYQLPAMREGCLAVVISPLRALMRDQVQALRSRGVTPRGARGRTAGKPEPAEPYDPWPEDETILAFVRGTAETLRPRVRRFQDHPQPHGRKRRGR